MRGVLFIIIILTAACSANDNKIDRQLQKDKYDTSNHLTNANRSVSKDTNTFKRLRCGLFINNTGDIAFKASDNSYKMDTIVSGEPIDVYLTTVWNALPYDSVTESRDELKNVVDTATLEILGWEHFKDKKHVYHFTPMMDGGSLTIMDYADPKTFKVLESYLYAIDKNYCYYRGERIKSADRKTFKVVDTSLAFHFALDKRNYYDGDLIMSKENVNQNGLDIK